MAQPHVRSALPALRPSNTTLIVHAAAMLALAAFFAIYDSGASYSATPTVTHVLTPVADAFVSSKRPTTNYGMSPRLKMDDSPVLTTFVRFDVGDPIGSVVRATLQVYARSTSSSGFDLRSVADNTWSESTITYANAPAFSSVSSGLSGPTTSGSWTSIDVTSLLPTDGGSLSVAVTTPAATEVDIDSRQGSRSPKLTIVTLPDPDITPPTTPTGLAAATTAATGVGVSWSASTDDTGVAGYDLFLDGTNVGQTSGTTYSFGDLTCGTTYTIGVDAYDKAGNHSSPASTTTSTSPCTAADSQPPTPPGSPTTSSATPTAVTLGWQASVDDTDVTGYDVFVDAAKAGTTTATSYALTGLACATSYTVGIEAFDAAGNRSARTSATATTSACPDTQPPTAPGNVTASNASTSSVDLSWSASTDDVGVAGYDVFASGIKVGTTPGTGFVTDGLACGTSYTLGVEAFDTAGNRSARTTVTASTAACPPGDGSSSVPAFRYSYSSDSDPVANKNLGVTLIDVGSKWSADATPAGTQGMVWVGDYDNTTCNWAVTDASLKTTVTAAKGDPKVFGFFFSDEPNPIACPNAPAQHQARSNLIHSIDPGMKTFIVLDSNGFSGNLTQDAIDQIPLWVGAADYIGLDPYPCLAGKSCNYAFISNMIAKADAAGIPYVGVLQAFDGTPIGEEFRLPTASELQAMVDLWAGSHEVGSAFFAWKWSTANWALADHPDLESVIKSFYTGGGASGDTTPPTAPGGLLKTSATTTAVSLGWSASTDDVGVSGYRVYNGDAQVGTTAATSFTVVSLSCGTTYTFGVTAADAAGNVSAKSTVTASTQACPPADTSPPSVPSGLGAAGATGTSLALSWTAATDDVGVAGYDVYLNGVRVSSTTKTSYGFGGLTCGTAYTLGVDAYDAAGNRSAVATATARTPACDTLAPTAPGTPTVTTTTDSSLTLWWSQSLDDVGVAGYDVYLNGTKVSTTAGTQYTFGGLACATSYTLGVEAFDASGNRSSRSSLLAATGACTSTTGDPVVAAAGDICGSPTDCAATEKLLESIDPTRVLTLGDNAYPDGSSSDYSNNYAPNWGKQLARTSPTPGNHDYHTAGAPGYFGYFGTRAPAPYYSFDLGAWHVISLNGEVSVSAGSAQETWLRNDLAAHPSRCILAYWHEPRFSSGSEHGNNTWVDPLWRDLYAAGADVVLNGHDHDYERFAPQSPSGVADPKGIREFVVGTGGDSHYTFGTPVANSEIRDNTSFGVLKLTLHASGYDWRFVPVAGASFTDTGSGSC